MQRQVSPHVCHVLVCTNDRHGVRKACADGDSVKLREHLKAWVHQQPHLNGRVRISAAGCLRLCAEGPNVIIYPQAIWFNAVTFADAPRLMATIEALVTGREPPA